MTVAEFPRPEPTGAVVADAPRPSFRYPGIDVLRAFAATGVVVAHITKWPWGYTQAAGMPGRVWNFWSQWIGNWGVGVFFILSGLCIHLPVARRLAEGRAPEIDLGRYFKRRARRIYPPHAVAIFASWAVAAWIALPPGYERYLSVPTPIQLVAHIFMVHTFIPSAFYSVSVVLWTIALEAHFYLLYPAILRLRRHFGMPAICAALFGLMVVLKVLVHAAPQGLASILVVNFPGRWWEWVLGAVLAERVAAAPRMDLSRGLALGAVALSAVGMCAVARLPHGVLVGVVLGPFVYGATVLVVTRMRSRPSSVLERLLVGVGVRSYSLYLTHTIALTLVLAAIHGRLETPALQVALALAASYLVMALYFRLVERRFMVPARPAVGPPADLARI
ncbi:MAG TPA: acyltransferase [Polyangia bacterium]|jgi:peptidoglycan/LPS O-acetylase OafA/YrhL